MYRYERGTLQLLTNLKGNVLFFPTPSVFNDPYDCTVMPRIKIPSDGDLEELRIRYLNEALPTHILEEFKTASLDDLREMVVRLGREQIAEYIALFKRTHGIACFTEIKDDLLMWAHYADSFRGVCLEFDSNCKPFSQASPVVYSPSIAEVDLISVLSKESHSLITTLFRTKTSAWAYEKEWRIIHEHANTRYHYQSDWLTAVYFGPEIERELVEIICLILQGQNEGIRFFQGKRSAVAYRVEFDEFSYTSHLQAKRLGLIS